MEASVFHPEMGRQCRLRHAEILSSSSVHLIMQLICDVPQVYNSSDYRTENWSKEADVML